MTKNISYGASHSEWEHFSNTLGLTADLLPVVSDPNAKISPLSGMSQLGKTPSVIGNNGAAGIKGWTSKISTEQDIARWSSNPDHGICLAMRTVRAFDIDVGDQQLADNVAEFIESEVGFLPCRTRPNSPKRLFLFSVVGDIPKRVLRLKEGMVEMLASGQQAVMVGTHTSGSRYEWLGGLPDSIPELTLGQLDSVWELLRERFSVGDPAVSSEPTISRLGKLHQAIEADPIAQHLITEGMVKSTTREGTLHITCPFESEHSTGAGAESSTSFFPANTNGYAKGHFACLHAGCDGRSDADFLDEIGYVEPSGFDDLGFDNLGEVVAEIKDVLGIDETDEVVELPKNKFDFIPASEFARGKPMRWTIAGLIPEADMAVVYGASAAGKTFSVCDMVFSVARGIPYRGRRVEKGRVAYIVAEGAGGFKSRLHAYSISHGISLSELDVIVMDGAPNLMSDKDALEIAKALIGQGIKLLVVDTFARSFVGSENDSKDVGAAIANCRKISKALKCTLLIVHHTGKISGNGPRGSAVFKDVADTMLEVVRDEATGERRIELGKLKDGDDSAQPIVFALQNVLTQFDDYGDPVVSCSVDNGGI